MELTHFQMYLITRVDTLGLMFSSCGVLATGGSIVSAYTSYALDLKSRSWCIPIGCLGLIMMFISCLIPTKSDIALIYAVPAIVNNQDVQSIPPELAKLARVKLEEMVKEAVTK